MSPHDVRSNELDEATSIFLKRDDERFKEYEPIVVRLAEAASRSGNFAIDDRILDLAIALERMYSLSGGRISEQLRTRAAHFLESATDRYDQTCEDVKYFYNVRSAIIHGINDMRTTVEAREIAFHKGFDIAQRTLEKLIHNGPPKDWQVEK